MATYWRPLGFILLSAAYWLLLLERVVNNMSWAALVVLWFGFYCIYRGTYLEPSLRELIVVGKKVDEKEQRKGIVGMLRDWWVVSDRNRKKKSTILKDVVADSHLLELVSVGSIVGWIGLIVCFLYYRDFVPVILEMLVLLYILATSYIQIRRYKYQNTDLLATSQNFYPMAAFILFGLRSILMIYVRWPKGVDISEYSITQDYGLLWYVSTLLTFGGFLFFSLWIMRFVGMRIAGIKLWLSVTSLCLVAIGLSWFVTVNLTDLLNNTYQQVLQRGILCYQSESANCTDVFLSGYKNKKMVFSNTGSQMIDLKERQIVNDIAKTKRDYTSMVIKNGVVYYNIYTFLPSDERIDTLSVYQKAQDVAGSNYRHLLQLFSVVLLTAIFSGLILYYQLGVGKK